MRDSDLTYWSERLDRLERCAIVVSEYTSNLPRLVKMVERVPKRFIVLLGVEDVKLLDVADVNLPLVVLPHALQNLSKAMVMSFTKPVLNAVFFPQQKFSFLRIP